MNTVAAFLMIWSLDTSGAGTVTITPQPTVHECAIARTAELVASCTDVDAFIRDAEWTGYIMAMNRCTVTTQNNDMQVWSCKGRK